MLPAVQPSIEGPRARPDQRQRQSQHGQQGGNARVGRRFEGDARPGARRDHSGDGRPQTGNQQEPGDRSNRLRGPDCINGCFDQAVQQGSAGQQPLQQKTDAWRAAGECGEQPLHNNPVFSLRASQQFRNRRKTEPRIPLLGESKFDHSAFQCDRDRVCAVVCAQFLENPADMAFHRIF